MLGLVLVSVTLHMRFTNSIELSQTKLVTINTLISTLESPTCSGMCKTDISSWHPQGAPKTCSSQI